MCLSVTFPWNSECKQPCDVKSLASLALKRRRGGAGDGGMDTSGAAIREVRSETRCWWGSPCPSVPREPHTATPALPSKGGSALGGSGTRGGGSPGRAGRRGGRKSEGLMPCLSGSATPTLPPRPPPVGWHYAFCQPRCLRLPGPGAAPPPAPRSRVGQPGRRLLRSPRLPAPVLNCLSRSPAAPPGQRRPVGPSAAPGPPSLPPGTSSPAAAPLPRTPHGK